MTAFSEWRCEPPDTDEPDFFEQFCDAHGLPYTEESWVAFEEFLAPDGAA